MKMESKIKLNKYYKEGLEIAKYLVKAHKLEKNVIAIYTMGSFAEGTANEKSDIDLNIFVIKADYQDISNLKIAINDTEKKFGRKIDNNIISQKEIEKGVINTLLFPHKYRHALLLFEIKYYNCLLYGKDILKSIKINYNELREETLKLLLTLGYRIRKIYLASGSLNEAKKQSVKFVTYACKFALIHKKIFIYGDNEVERRFLKEFPNLNDLDIVKRCFKIKRKKEKITKNIFERSINFIERLSEELLKNYLNNKNGKK